MRDKEKSRSGAATPEREGETRAPGQAAHISVPDDSIAPPKRQYHVEALLLHGAENALSTAYLVQITKCGSARQLRKAIESERESGALILSTVSGGYYLPDRGEKGRREMMEYIRTMRARAFNTLKSTKAASEALKLLHSQEQMDELVMFEAGERSTAAETGQEKLKGW